MLESPFVQLALIMVVAVAIGTLALVLRQPLIVAFIAVGVLVGPAGLGWVTAGTELELLASMGISVLLFLVGLKLDPKLIRTTGRVALATGLGQVAFTSVFGFGIAIALGLDVVSAIYVAVALTFSSTIIIVKLLSDKREVDDLHGRIAIGFLIIQDILVVLALIVVTALGDVGTGGVAPRLIQVLLQGVMFLAALAALMRWVIPPFVGRIAQSRELLILFSLSWAIVLAAAGDQIGLSVEVGAFLAGVSLASTPYREAIASRLVSLRDFLLLFFFIDLGAQLQLHLMGERLGEAVVFSLFVLIGNPLIVIIIMGVMRYRVKTSFLAGLTVAQISEFSLILVALGLRVGHIDESILGLVTMVGLITIGLSTYLIMYSHQIFDRLERYLGIFERRHLDPMEEHHGLHEGNVDVILYGGGRHGTLIANSLTATGWRVLVVDIDPDALKQCRRQGLEVIYGDAEDPEFLLSLPLEHARWIVSTVRGADINLALVHGLRAASYAGQIAITAHDPIEAQRLENVEVDVVIAPFAVAAERLVDTLVVAPPDTEPVTEAEGAKD
ncbi:MAG: cation:proton antiporter [Actinomycetota bacterium]|nr:cation:proton antiporter [Actinomycetota bacterium]